MPKMVEVRDGLAHREEALLQVELAAEQHGHHVGRGHRRWRRRRSRPSSSASRASWCARSCATRIAMPRNGKPCDGSTRVCGGSDSNAASECEEAAERIAVGIGPATRETLVLILGSSMSPAISTSAHRSIQRRVLRRVAVARDDAPVASPPATTCRRAGCGRTRRALPARRACSGCRARPARSRRSARMPWQAEELAGVGRRVRRALVDDRVRGHELAVRHRHAAAEALRDPRRVAEVIGMAMRGDDARRCGLPPQRRARSAAPTARAFARRRSRVSTSVQPRRSLEQPQVDVVERERQRHAQPQDAGRDGATPCPARAARRTG